MRAAFEAWAAQQCGREAWRHTNTASGEWTAWKAAVANEREACAKVCADIAKHHTLRAVDSFGGTAAAEACEEAIRARSKP